MLNQNFSTKELLRFLKLADLRNHKTTKTALIHDLDAVCDLIAKGTFDFSIQKRDSIYLTEKLTDILILRKINDHLKRLYKDEQANRRIIINQVATLLPDNCAFWVLRTDIAKFYESIDRNRIIGKLRNDAMVSYFSLALIKKLFDHPLIVSETGLPRGIGLSATLSEVYMRKFDRYIRGHDGVYFYARFVDDILIFSHKKDAIIKIKDEMDFHLEEGLIQNKKKTSLFDGLNIKPTMPLNYLGYKFTSEKIGKVKKVNISISDNKVKKIKTRIVLSFVSYLKAGDLAALENRIKFLTGNYSIRSASDDGHDLRAGIYYNYQCINCKTDLNDLNVFYQKILFSRHGSLGAKLNMSLSVADRDRLKKYSFRNGFSNKIHHRFTYSEMKMIKEGWRNE